MKSTPSRQHRPALGRWLAIAVAIAAALAATPSEARTFGSLDFEPCTLASASGIGGITEAQCATLSVPENHATPDGRHIDLAIAWLPGDGRDEHPDPVFMLAGGPGQSARDSFPQVEAAFAPVNRLRDIILVDQRGTGASHPLQCAIDDAENDSEGDASTAADRQAAIAQAVAQVKQCLSTLKDSDPRFYTTSDAIADLDAVRAALGVDKINLVGISYGTRVAQQYARRYPAHTRSVVLDSPVPNELMLGQDHARNLEAALNQQFARCAADKACQARFGDPRQQLDELLTRLKDGPSPSSWRHPQTGAAHTGLLRRDDVVGLVRMYAYMPAAASLLPLLIDEALKGRSDVLRAQIDLLQGELEGQFSRGMELSVICSEDAAGLMLDPADESTLLGTRFIEQVKAQCAVWPKGELPADFHQPIQSALPFLVLTGEFDPVTPPRYGEQIMQGLSNARLLTVQGQGHNLIPVGCMPRVMADFIDQLDPKKLDVACLDDVPYTPPFAGFYGWEP